jgi:hypothetical protein
MIFSVMNMSWGEDSGQTNVIVVLACEAANRARCAWGKRAARAQLGRVMPLGPSTRPSVMLGLVAMLMLAAAAAAPSRALAAPCENEALRIEQRSTQLPECRAWELVSPAEKHGSNVSTLEGTDQASPSGDAIAFASSGAFSGAEGNPVVGFYVARRETDGDGWSTRSVEPPQQNQATLLARGTLTFSPELTTAFQVSRDALESGGQPVAGAQNEQGNAYISNNVTGKRTLLATSGEEHLFFNLFAAGQLTRLIAATPDDKHIVFGTEAKLTADAQSVFGNTNLYEWNEGHLQLASVLPGDVPSSGNAATGGLYPGVTGSSPKLIFSVEGGAEEGLFSREGGTTTAISVSQRVPHTPLQGSEVPLGGVAPATFAGASAGGSIVYFSSQAPLTDTAPTSSIDSLYRYEAATGTLSVVASNTESSEVMHVIQVSDDGSYVYFTAQSALAPGASLAEGGSTTNIYVWHRAAGTDTIRFIGQTSCHDGNNAAGEPVEDCPESEAPHEWDASPSGQYFAFASYAALTGNDTINESRCPATESSPDGACLIVYGYDAQRARLSCISCGPDATRPAGSSYLDNGDSTGTPVLGDYKPHNVLEDGRVFFDSPNDLTPEATNGRRDVYEGNVAGGEDALISSPTAEEDAYFAGATLDGRNVFFRTSAPLVTADKDSNYDVYDARVGGGIAAQNTTSSSPECRGDECQGPPAPTPTIPLPASALASEPEAPLPLAAAFTIARPSAPQLATFARTGRLRLAVTVNRPGAITLLARTDLAGGIRTVAKAHATASGPGRVAVTLQLPATIRRQLERRHSLTLRVTVAFTNAAGAQQLTLTLRQPADQRRTRR